MESAAFLDVFQEFNNNTKSPENFISAQPNLESSFNNCTKRLFDLSHDCQYVRKAISSNSLTELIIEGLDGEQIWEEIELTNEPCLKYMVHGIAKVVKNQHDVTLLRPACKHQIKHGTKKEEDITDDIEEDYDGSQDLFQELKKKSQSQDFTDSDSSDKDSETNFDIDKLESQSKNSAQKSSSKIQQQIYQGRTSVVDDTFFKLSEMEKFLEVEDAKEERRRQKEGAGDVADIEEESDAESIDLFDELFSDEDMEGSGDEEIQEKSARDMVYNDFFGPGTEQKQKRKKSVHFEDVEIGEDIVEEEDTLESRWRDESEDADDDVEDKDDDGNEDDEEKASEEEEAASDILADKSKEIMSTFERRQEKLKHKIEQLEEANITTKPWQLSGEVRSSKRPENSLLQENLDFEVTSKPAPVITEETTQALEDIVRQRILDHAWDDVERKERPLEEAYEFKKRITLDQEKSKLSLAEIYEKEFLKQSEQGKEEDKNPAQDEIKKMMDALFVKLDALSNFHFIPKPILPEVKIVPNVPSISMEEVAPITATEASLLAPEEIQEKSTLEVKGDSEKTTTDKKQALRKKKKAQRVRARAKQEKQRAVEKLQPGVGNKYSMKGALKRLEQDSKMPSSKTTIIKSKSGTEKSLSSSKSFFGRLQDEVTSELKGIKKKRNPNQQTFSSKKLKL